jgi:hypothetical protein
MPDEVTVDAMVSVKRSVLDGLITEANKLDCNDLGGSSLKTCEDCKQETVHIWDPKGTGWGYCTSCGSAA